MNPTWDAEVALRAWSRVDANSATGEACWPAHLPVFIGHFPGQPLVPGVHQIAVLGLLVRRALGRDDLVLVGMLRSKWLAPVRPGDVLALAARWQERPGEVLVETTSAMGGTPVATSRLRLAVKIPVG